MLPAGTTVTAYWTIGPARYRARAIVAWVSDDHVTVLLDGPVTTLDNGPALSLGTSADYVCFSRYAQTADVRCKPSVADKA